MQIFTESQGALVCFWLSLLFVVTGFCYGDHRTVEVVGLGECADCKQYNIMTSLAFSGLRVTVDCKSANGDFETIGAGELEENGNFKISLPHDIVKDNEVKGECYAQLHSASAAPCPAHDGLDKSKIVIKSKTGGNHTLGPAAGKLKFSFEICTSTFFWPFFNHPLFPKLQHPQYYYPFPPKVSPPLFPPKFFPKHPLLPHVPVHKAPLPPPSPVIKKPSLPPPAPVIKKPSLPPPAPVIKKPSLPPPAPIYKKPLPPPVPTIVKKPCPPKVKKPLPPPVPIVKKPCPPKAKKLLPPPPTPIHKPLPPFFKPLPPFPKLPPLFKKKPCPPLPTIPPKYFFDHPKFGAWPPLPPFSPHS